MVNPFPRDQECEYQHLSPLAQRPDIQYLQTVFSRGFGVETDELLGQKLEPFFGGSPNEEPETSAFLTKTLPWEFLNPPFFPGKFLPLSTALTSILCREKPEKTTNHISKNQMG